MAKTFLPPKGIECADVTARKAHQYTVVTLAVVGLLLGGPTGVALLVLDGAVMLAGRFWGPADVFRQLVWRVAEPRGWLAPRMVPEELGTRRVARVLGGIAFFVIAVALSAGNVILAWVVALPLCAMILFDATASFCALCFVNFQTRRLWFIATHRAGTVSA